MRLPGSCPRPARSRAHLGTLGTLLAVAALVGWVMGSFAAGRRPSPPQPASRRLAADAAPASETRAPGAAGWAGRAGDPGAGPGLPPANLPQPPGAGAKPALEGAANEPLPAPEREAAERLADAMKRMVRDLEYNAGLPEPPQQVVVPSPAPWTPARQDEGEPPPVIDELTPRGGPASGGALITIRGRNLRVAQVMFGPAPARIVSAGQDEVTVVAPAALPGPVTIALTNVDGSYAIAAVPFTYGM